MERPPKSAHRDHCRCRGDGSMLIVLDERRRRRMICGIVRDLARHSYWTSLPLPWGVRALMNKVSTARVFLITAPCFAATGAIVPAEARDTSFMRSTWQVVPPDTLVVSRSNGFTGQFLGLRSRGTDFAG